METLQYTYTGKIEIELVGYGVVQPKETITVTHEINNPLFVRVEKDTKKK